MLEERRLSLDEADAVIRATFAASSAAGHRGVAVVVTDKYGEIISGARMDGLAPRYFKAAHRKSYTAAVFERDTADVLHFWQRQEAAGHRGPSDWNDPMFTTLPGGITVRHGEAVVGGIGVAGGSAAPVSDGDFAEVAIAALGPAFRHEELHQPPAPG
ncbi:MAG TPA: heme-binding protein [Acidimicrobiales bacterium]|nr:heme-binding protein [Acidimicrobiales bacterium]